MNDKIILPELLNKNKTILILGPADSDFRTKNIAYYSSENHVENTYGKNSELTKAFKIAKNNGAECIFLCNCYKTTDYIKILNLILQNEFAYIVPIGINFSDTISMQSDKDIYIGEIYSNLIAEKNSLILMTDKHASLYEDIESYIKDIVNISTNFKKNSYKKLPHGNNLYFIANMLKDYEYANIVLASILASNELKTYPKKDIGEVVFDIDYIDLYNNEIVFFKYDNLYKTSIENFINYNEINSSEKSGQIDLIKKYILRNISFDLFRSKLFNSYIKIMIEQHAIEEMDSFVGKIINGYKILSIDYFKDNENAISIVVNIRIYPYNYTDYFDIVMEV